ncbi:hypothetical protein LMG28614_01851 [Paraburkholderia ultramafica]|uniref:Uncharacterized protein n=1 Tax=Paraburkholderia ultramafica TaxID=1544867 RepID=A0A6S7BC99_9BURK|nr:hypothetical protein [Paraburkholderia ultramafica]CAB3784027.1 hypothetical protein LMG28614_01851 [Paraburkholderia ultramafica]
MPEQLELLPPPPLCATWPSTGTFAAEVLSRLLRGERLTQPSFGPERGWRLAAYVFELQTLGWSIVSTPVRTPGRARAIAEYSLSAPTIRAARRMRGKRNGAAS